MDRIEVENVTPVEEVDMDNPPPSYDAVVKKNNYFPEVLMHQKKSPNMAIVKQRTQKRMESELSFLNLVIY